HVHAGRDDLWHPALPSQAGWRAELDRPLHRLAFAIIDHHVDPTVWVGPLEFLDGAFDGDRLLGIEHGEGVMCLCRNRTHDNSHGRESDWIEVHGRLQVFSLGTSLFGQVPLWAHVSFGGLANESETTGSISRFFVGCNTGSGRVRRLPL